MQRYFVCPERGERNLCFPKVHTLTHMMMVGLSTNHLTALPNHSYTHLSAALENILTPVTTSSPSIN